MKQPLVTEISKTYPPRERMQQFRMAESSAFRCMRCGEAKKSKLLIVYENDWSRLLCNGCYGRLVSIYDIKSGTASDDEKASALADVLLSLYSQDQLREAGRLYVLSKKRASVLSQHSLLFLSSAERVAQSVTPSNDFDWSLAIIGLCKAVEFEVVERILVPLAQLLRSTSVEEDLKDKDLGRVVAFLSGQSDRPPELGAVVRFLNTSLNSKSRRLTSPAIAGVYRLFSSWPDSEWLSNSDGFYASLDHLRSEFRNKAAHLTTLSRQEYEDCRDLVSGPTGILWKLASATTPLKKA